MELVKYDIPWRQGASKPFYLSFLGDIQWSGKGGPTAKDTLKRHIDRCVELGAWYVGMGDYIDFMSPSNRQRMRAAALYDTAEDVIDEKAMDLVHEVFDLFLRPTKGRWIGLLEGHHFSQLKSGDTTDQRLAEMLGARFLGTSAYINLQFCIGTGKYPVALWVHHGCGGGMTDGAPLTRLDRIAARFEGADVFAMGHTTKSPSTRIPKPYPNWHAPGGPKLVHRDALLVNTGGFSKSYVEGSMNGRTPRGGYAEQRMLPPSSVGAPILEIRPHIEDRQTNNVRHRQWAPEIKVIL
ncbi:MAG TPA: hypothetical protein VEA38_00930 [Terriglobales bacterium]|nr:hypothetical protein [Terriglobales bacterium]